jgi:hypothetical protein
MICAQFAVGFMAVILLSGIPSSLASWGMNYRGSADREAVVALKECHYFKPEKLDLLQGATFVGNRITRVRLPLTKDQDDAKYIAVHLGDCKNGLTSGLCDVVRNPNCKGMALGRNYTEAIITKCMTKYTDSFGLPAVVDSENKLDTSRWYSPTGKQTSLQYYAVTPRGPLVTKWDKFHETLANKIVDLYDETKNECLEQYLNFMIDALYFRYRALRGGNANNDSHLKQVQILYSTVVAFVRKIATKLELLESLSSDDQNSQPDDLKKLGVHPLNAASFTIVKNYLLMNSGNSKLDFKDLKFKLNHSSPYNP